MSIPESAITAARKAYDECEGIWTDDAVAVENIARTMHAYAQQMVKAERDAIAAMPRGWDSRFVQLLEETERHI